MIKSIFGLVVLGNLGLASTSNGVNPLNSAKSLTDIVKECFLSSFKKDYCCGIYDVKCICISDDFRTGFFECILEDHPGDGYDISVFYNELCKNSQDVPEKCLESKRETYGSEKNTSQQKLFNAPLSAEVPPDKSHHLTSNSDDHDDGNSQNERSQNCKNYDIANHVTNSCTIVCTVSTVLSTLDSINQPSSDIPDSIMESSLSHINKSTFSKQNDHDEEIVNVSNSLGQCIFGMIFLMFIIAFHW